MITVSSDLVTALAPFIIEMILNGLSAIMSLSIFSTMAVLAA